MKLMTFLLVFYFCFLVFSSKGLTMGEHQKKNTNFKKNFSELNISDGVNKDEAKAIAENFIKNDNYLSTAVVIPTAKVFESGLKDVIGDCWAVNYRAKLSIKMKTGLKWFIVHIDKSTGEIKTTGWGPA